MIFIHIYVSPRLVYVIVGLYCDTQTLNLMYVRWVPDNLEPPLLQYLYLRSVRLFEPCSRRAISKNDGQLFYMFSLKKYKRVYGIVRDGFQLHCILSHKLLLNNLYYYNIWLIILWLYHSLIFINLEVKEGSWPWMSIKHLFAFLRNDWFSLFMPSNPI